MCIELLCQEIISSYFIEVEVTMLEPTVSLSTLLDAAWRSYELAAGMKLGARLKRAFLSMPRHRFIPRFQHWGDPLVHEVVEENLSQHLPYLYADSSIRVVCGRNELDYTMASTPSLVLTMLKLLHPSEGERIAEVGTGSGWNAALLSSLVGRDGHISSYEITHSVADQAEAILQTEGIPNVSVIRGDVAASVGDEEFDGIIYTCGAHDIPPNLIAALREGGRMLFVLRLGGSALSLLTLLTKHKDVLRSSYSRFCLFMPDTGNTRLTHLDYLDGGELLAGDVVDRRPVSLFRSGLVGASGAFQSYLAIAYPLRYQSVQSDDMRDGPFTFRCARGSVLIKNGEVITFGDRGALDEFLDIIKEWFSLGTPLPWEMQCTTYIKNARLEIEEYDYLLTRPYSSFAFKRNRDLPGGALP